jgi:membrane-associated phospholipid phosphatase
MSFLGLLAMQMAFFVLFPVATPESWRAINSRQTWSERFLAFVQRLDARSNSFPSMHTSVATLTALYLQPHLGMWAFLFPVLIGLSCLFTKQHYLVDLPAGAALGWVAYRVFALV